MVREEALIISLFLTTLKIPKIFKFQYANLHKKYQQVRLASLSVGWLSGGALSRRKAGKGLQKRLLKTVKHGGGIKYRNTEQWVAPATHHLRERSNLENHPSIKFTQYEFSCIQYNCIACDIVHACKIYVSH